MDSRTRAILTGAAATIGLSILGFIPFVGACCSCLAILASGFAATWDYTRREQVTIPGGDGAKMGALAGAAAFGITTVLMLVVWAALGAPNLADLIIPRIEQQMNAQPGMTPEMLDQMLGIYEMVLGNPAFLVGFSILGLFIQVIGGVLGGLIGASVFKKGGDLRPEQTY